MIPVLALVLAFGSVTAFSSTGGGTTVTVPEPRAGWSFAEVRRIPVQSGGRVKPLDSYAQEIVLFETGSKTWNGWDPVELLISWIARPQDWENQPFIKINNQDVRKQLGLDVERSRFSPMELFHESYLAQYAESLAGQGEDSAKTQDERQKELGRVLERIGLFRRTTSGEAWPVIPVAAPGTWSTLAGDDGQGALIRRAFADVVRAYNQGDQKTFEQTALVARAAVEGSIPGWTAADRRLIRAESLYNQMRPFFYSWILYLLAALAWSIAIFSKQNRPMRAVASVLTLSGMLAHVTGFALRCYVAGRPPVTNMYESMIWVSLGVMIFGSILYWRQRKSSDPSLIVPAVACGLAFFTLVSADAAPAVLDPSIHPLVPVLRSNYWLTIHVLTITLSYAAFMLSLGLGNVALFHFARKQTGWMARTNHVNQLNYRSMQFGVVLLAAGTILGGIWADYSWGRFWGWDPKEVWALVALLAYLVILHGRFAGWVGPFGFAAWTVVSFLTVVMAWYGVNFVLGVGLHSYGFSTGGRGWVASFILVQLLYVGITTVLHRIGIRRQLAAS